MPVVLFFKPDKGLINWSNRAALHDFLLENDGKEMYAEMDKVKGVRSLSQNAYYWKYLEIIALETGHNAEELHRLFKGLFLAKKEVTWKGKQYMMSGSTTKLNKVTMGEYLEKIAAETEVPLPDPTLADITK